MTLALSLHSNSSRQQDLLMSQVSVLRLLDMTHLTGWSVLRDAHNENMGYSQFMFKLKLHIFRMTQFTLWDLFTIMQCTSRLYKNIQLSSVDMGKISLFHTNWVTQSLQENIPHVNKNYLYQLIHCKWVHTCRSGVTVAEWARVSSLGSHRVRWKGLIPLSCCVMSVRASTSVPYTHI